MPISKYFKERRKVNYGEMLRTSVFAYVIGFRYLGEVLEKLYDIKSDIKRSSMINNFINAVDRREHSVEMIACYFDS